MKTKIIVLLVLLTQGTVKASDDDHKLGWYAGIMLEPSMSTTVGFTMPAVSTISMIYDHRVKITTFGGYMVAHHQGLMIGGRVAYEFQLGHKKSFMEVYAKIERVFAHHPYTYYGVGIGYGIKIGKFFYPVLALEYGTESDRNLFKVELELPLNFHLKSKKRL